VFVIVLREIALLAGLLAFSFFLLALAGVVLPAGANCHQDNSQDNKHQSMSKLVDRNNPEVILLPFR
jgi:hypothetical protein